MGQGIILPITMICDFAHGAMDFQHSNTPPLHGLEFTKGDDSGLNLALLRFQCGDYVRWDELVHVAAEA
ncbi:MAG: hypothetical protein RL015_3154 [Verrucomicrobiota bacterium]